MQLRNTLHVTTYETCLASYVPSALSWFQDMIALKYNIPSTVPLLDYLDCV